VTRLSLRFPLPAVALAVALALAVAVASPIASGCRSADPQPPAVDNQQVKNRGEDKDEWWDALPRPAWNAVRKVSERQGWFEVYEIRPGIFAIYEPGQFEEAISYLVVGKTDSLLFDTGLGIGDIHQVVMELTDIEPVVVNSHTHYDHVGGNHQFRRIYGTSTEYTRRSARGRPHEEVAEFVSDGWIWKPTPAGFSRDTYHGEPFEISKTLEEGEVIDLGGRKLEVLLTPGHAPDSLCLFDRENRLLFTGDTFYPAVLYAHLPGSDVATYGKTAGRLAALASEVDFLIPSHNEPLVPGEALVRLRDAFEAIARTDAPFVVTDGAREYRFEGFSILTPDPLP
jgi:glyoxylase-like metal-dependent hydrolase (beta-lactamase superfamily II)